VVRFLQWLESDASDIDKQQFSREVIDGWLHGLGLPSKYRFKDDGRARIIQAGPRWPAHDTEKLTALRLAAVKFWSNYNPAEPDAARTNDVVSAWLQKERGIARTVADTMATILRPDNLPPGPRPKK
jgi:hypothetical protein